MSEDAGREQLLIHLVDQLRSGALRIPPYPAIAIALERLRAAGSSLGEVAELVSTDAALAATVLRRARSAATSTSNKAPMTIETAIWRIGFDELLQLVFATTLGGTTLRSGPLAMLRRDAWRRSLLSAILCKDLAPRRGLVGDQAFLAGLLHGFGAIVVIACAEAMGDRLPKMNEVTWQQVVAEKQEDFGVVLANKWNLPTPIVEAIAHHARPERCEPANRPLVTLINTVDQAIHELDRAGACAANILEEVAGVYPDERRRVRSMLARAAEQMAAFEMPTNSDASTTLTTVMERIDIVPVDMKLTSKSGQTYKCSAIGDETIILSGPALATGWIAELTFDLHRPVSVLVNVRSCVPAPDGSCAIIARPFGLDDDARAAWFALAHPEKLGAALSGSDKWSR